MRRSAPMDTAPPPSARRGTKCVWGEDMAGTPGRSGGPRRRSARERDKGALHWTPGIMPASASLTKAGRRRLLADLDPVAKAAALGILAAFAIDDAAIPTVRSWAQSCSRLAVLETDATKAARGEIHKEARINVLLLRALNLEAQR